MRRAPTWSYVVRRRGTSPVARRPQEFLSHGWDVVKDAPLPSPIFQFHYGGQVDPQANAPDGAKTMEMMGTSDVFFIPDECEAKPNGECEFSASSEVYTSATKYARSLAVSAGISAEIAVIGAFSASASYESASEGMQEGEKDMFILKVREREQQGVGSTALTLRPPPRRPSAWRRASS